MANIDYLDSVALLLSPYPSLSGSVRKRILANASEGVETLEKQNQCSGCHSVILSGLNGSIRLQRDRNGQTQISIECEGCLRRTLISVGAEGKSAFKRINRKQLAFDKLKKSKIPILPTLPPPTPSAFISATTIPPQHSHRSTPLKVLHPVSKISSNPILSTPSKATTNDVPATDSNKKRKRSSKQSSGLAQMLEDKRRKEKEEKSGLGGFLQGL